jgi:hypothetical protein
VKAVCWFDSALVLQLVPAWRQQVLALVLQQVLVQVSPQQVLALVLVLQLV